MHDLLLLALWVGILIGGLGVCALLFRIGVPRTYVRDLLHVGAGSWVLGWPWWEGWIIPAAIPALAFAALAVLPLRKVRESVSDQDERWSGIILYALAFAVLTPVGLLKAPFPAGAALLALALGDGIGGAVGRRFGRTRFRVPWAKTKSLEGTVAVAVAAGVGVAIAARVFGATVSPGWWIGAALVAALAEALAPRASDNLLLPAVVTCLLLLAPGT